MIQYLIIFLIVLWALLYSAWSLMPAPARRTLAQRAGGWARRIGLGEKQAQGLQTRLAQTADCGACSSCKGCGTAAPAPSTRATNSGRIRSQP